MPPGVHFQIQIFRYLGIVFKDLKSTGNQSFAFLWEHVYRSQIYPCSNVFTRLVSGRNG